TGGNFGGFKMMGKDYINLSFPIAEISADGTTVVTKQPGQNGIVTVDTGKTASSLRAPRGLPPPENLKVSVQAYGGFQAEVNALAIGLDIEEKAESWGNMTRAILRSDEKLNTGEYSDFTIQCIGRAEPNPRNQNAATAHVRVMAQAPNKETLSVDNFMNPVIENLISGFPGFTPDMEYLRTGLPKPYMTYFPGLIPRSVLEEVRVHFLDGSESIAVPHPAETLSYETAPKQENYEPNEPVDLASFGETVSIPLGYKVHARSGDKGANVNVGFFPQTDSEEEWEWLRSFMTTNKLMELLGDDAEDVLRTERTEFPNLHGVHFVLVGILGDGVNCTKRPDALGKGIGEYVRAKYVDYPKKMYGGYEKRI
ncbi:hypothetical protein LTR40_009109, partial [Exophiala xenobiotica]